ncbi:sepiapterin reductase isoform X2 [Belonocnema kinseyi]|uniref:sepiapterin reductase isoform X2 n=1 Tax=Belonocnema kinseyi TaxID=2817044 RepID=UPI00143D36C4|nr:sepiapterin reductase isoform X2 [Belonocnema kinseyi]
MSPSLSAFCLNAVNVQLLQSERMYGGRSHYYSVVTGTMTNFLKNDEISKFDQAMIVHNAGSLGNIAQKTIEMTNFTVWRQYYDLNVFSPAILNNVFMKFFGSQVKCKIFIVNITSLCALQPMKSLAYYCSGKAAREMFFKVFAAENPDVNVLNYSPGPVKTNMLNVVCQDVGDTEVKKKFNELKDKDTALSPEKTVTRLLQVLVEQNYVSGDHVDFYDIL